MFLYNNILYPFHLTMIFLLVTKHISSFVTKILFISIIFSLIPLIISILCSINYRQLTSFNYLPKKTSRFISILWSNVLRLSSNPQSALLRLERPSSNIFSNFFLCFLILWTSLLKIYLFLLNSSISIYLLLVDSVALIINVVSFLLVFFTLVNLFLFSDTFKSCLSMTFLFIEASIMITNYV